MGRTANFHVTSGGLSSFVALRKLAMTPPLPSGHSAKMKLPSMSPVRPSAPQPVPARSGKLSWPMKEAEGVVESGNVKPKPKIIRTPKKHSIGRPVLGSTKGLELCAVDDVASSAETRSNRIGERTLE